MGRMLGLVTLAMFMLTGCGGSNEAGGGGAGDQKLLTVQAVIDELGQDGVTCSHLKMSGNGSEGQNQLYTREDGRCSIGDEEVNVVTFDGAAQRDQYLQVAKQFGGIYVTGETWAVATETQGTADKVKAALGGEIR